MVASSLLSEGYLQPAGDLSKAAVDGTAENPFLDNPDAFYYFVSEKGYPSIYSLQWRQPWADSRLTVVYSHVYEKKKRPNLKGNYQMRNDWVVRGGRGQAEVKKILKALKLEDSF